VAGQRGGRGLKGWWKERRDPLGLKHCAPRSSSRRSASGQGRSELDSCPTWRRSSEIEQRSRSGLGADGLAQPFDEFDGSSRGSRIPMATPIDDGRPAGDLLHPGAPPAAQVAVSTHARWWRNSEHALQRPSRRHGRSEAGRVGWWRADRQPLYSPLFHVRVVTSGLVVGMVSGSKLVIQTAPPSPRPDARR